MGINSLATPRHGTVDAAAGATAEAIADAEIGLEEKQRIVNDFFVGCPIGIRVFTKVYICIYLLLGRRYHFPYIVCLLSFLVFSLRSGSLSLGFTLSLLPYITLSSLRVS